jgi:hypothetical protein
MLNVRKFSARLFTIILTVVLVAGFVPASGAGTTYAEGGNEYEDCDGDGYDDATGDPLPWVGFDYTQGDTIPDDWDGEPGSYERPSSGGVDNGGNNSGGNNCGGNNSDGNNNDGNNNGGDNGSGDNSNDQNSSGTDTENRSGGAGNVQSTVPDTGQGDENVLIKTFSKTPKPKITGTAKVGKTLKASVGAWTPEPEFTYRWYSNGKVIKGATKASLKLKKAQKGKKITVKVTAKKTGYDTEIRTSKATKKVK